MSRKTNKLKSRLAAAEREIKNLKLRLLMGGTALGMVREDLAALKNEKAKGWRADGSMLVAIRPSSWRMPHGHRYAFSIEINADEIFHEWTMDRRGSFSAYDHWLRVLSDDLGRKAVAALAEFFQVKMGFKAERPLASH
jgi:hypothetical protein